MHSEGNKSNKWTLFYYFWLLTMSGLSSLFFVLNFCHFTTAVSSMPGTMRSSQPCVKASWDVLNVDTWCPVDPNCSVQKTTASTHTPKRSASGLAHETCSPNIHLSGFLDWSWHEIYADAVLPYLASATEQRRARLKLLVAEASQLKERVPVKGFLSDSSM